MTPFERHRQAHGRTSHTPHPNGHDIIEECEQCRLAWILPCKLHRDSTPITLYHHWEYVDGNYPPKT